MKNSLIIVSGVFEAREAIRYQVKNSLEKCILVSADINSSMYFSKNSVEFFEIYQLLPGRSSYIKDHKLSNHVVKKFINLPRIRQALTVDGIDYTDAFKEMLHSKISEILKDFFALSHICRKTQCHRLIINEAFSKNIVKLVVSDLKLNTQSLPTSHLGKGVRKVKIIFSEIKETIFILAQHPLVSLRMFRQRLISVANLNNLSQSEVVVFSNGLHLASYHSVLSSLSQKLILNVFTDKQSLIDSFYLAQYRVRTKELNSTNLESHKSKEINLQLIKNVQKLQEHSLKLKVKIPSWIKAVTLNQLLVDKLTNLTLSWFSNFLLKAKVAKTVIAKTKPKLLITTHDPGPSAMAFVLEAKRNNIKTVNLLHGSPSENHFFFSDKEIIWGKTIKRFLVSHGTKPHRLILGGQPIFYDYKLFLQKHQNKSSNKFNLGILTSGYGRNEINQVEYFLKLFPEISKANRAFTITVRTHPQQYIDGLNLLAKKYGLKISVNPAQLLEEFIAKNHIIITQHTTAALTALIGKKPTIFLQADHPTYKGSLADQTVFYQSSNADEVSIFILQAISSYQENSRRKTKINQFLNGYCGPINKNIGRDIAERITKTFKLTPNNTAK